MGYGGKPFYLHQPREVAVSRSKSVLVKHHNLLFNELPRGSVLGNWASGIKFGNQGLMWVSISSKSARLDYGEVQLWYE
jgi:hypothetical protein